ncbi:hypothetical protein [Candidatus Uabimicrobium amorphum]|uniref:DUF5667 domain-containing protein n=1 Tax=Uabimicrobium amorphum TaxID=2596890 RepID=A0A5S9F254_UABAM|nr:hypothetical protein [Candidatus Uabimicrobium amorphum]BBM83256.1 hypothetical protein UABAM_01607 [Candidatus Uabimicrobium amorphum]
MNKYMKLFFIVCFFLPLTHIFAETEHKITYDLLTCDKKTDLLDEGDDKFSVTIKISGKVTKGDLALLDKLTKKTLKRQRKKINKRVIKFNNRLGKLDLTDKGHRDWFREKAQDELNQLWEGLQSNAETQVKKDVQKKWKEIQKNNKAYKKHKIVFRVRFAVHVIKISSTIISIVASGGTNIISYVSLVLNIATFANFIKESKIDQDKTRKALVGSLAVYTSEAERLQKARDENREESIIEAFEESLENSKNTLLANLAEHRVSVGKMQTNVLKMDKKITKAKKQYEKLQKKMKKNDVDIQNTEEDLAKLDKKIQDLDKALDNLVSDIDDELERLANVGVPEEEKTFLQAAKSYISVSTTLEAVELIGSIVSDIVVITS